MSLLACDVNNIMNLDSEYILSRSMEFIKDNNLTCLTNSLDPEFNEKTLPRDIKLTSAIYFLCIFNEDNLLMIDQKGLSVQTDHILGENQEAIYRKTSIELAIAEIKEVSIYEDEDSDTPYLSINGYLISLHAEDRKKLVLKLVEALIYILQLNKVLSEDKDNLTRLHTLVCKVCVNGLFCKLDDAGIFEYFKALLKSTKRMKMDRNLFELVRMLQYEIGYGHLMGKGKEAEAKEAVKWLEAASKKGCHRAQNLFGYCLFNGIGTEKDLIRAFIYYKTAAEKGNTVAMYNLGLCYLSGFEGLDQDMPEAFYCFRKSALRGYPDAQNNLGSCYYYGYGVKIHMTGAAIWYRKSANSGNGLAKFNLANMYYLGKGVSKDLAAARSLYEKAAASGFNKASEMLEAKMEKDSAGIELDNYFGIEHKYFS